MWQYVADLVDIHYGHGLAIITAVDSILFLARARQKQIIALIREMVECESPSDNPAAVNRFVDLLADVAPSGATTKTYPGGRFGRHVICEFSLPGKKEARPDSGARTFRHRLAARHAASMPFREKNGRLWGPGVLDMKAGIAFFLFAMRILRDLDVPVPSQSGAANQFRRRGRQRVIPRAHGKRREAQQSRAGAGAWHWSAKAS